eukprot:7073002-Pyramimonas_sp.AAC.1
MPAIRAAFRTLLTWLAICAGSVRGNEDSEAKDLNSNNCKINCERVFIGDKNCDLECYNEDCQWDAGDCADQCASNQLLFWLLPLL